MTVERNDSQAVSAVQASPRGLGSILEFFDRRPVLRFVSMVAVIMGLFYGSMATPFFGERVFNAYLRFNASATAFILSLFGESAVASGMTVTTPRYGLEIHRGCDAIEPMAMFVAGVVALQTPLRAKVIGLLAGLLTLLVMNFIRIVSLYYVGVHWRAAFETMHVSVWQTAFIFLTVGLYLIWALWATKPAPKVTTHVTG